MRRKKEEKKTQHFRVQTREDEKEKKNIFERRGMHHEYCERVRVS